MIIIVSPSKTQQFIGERKKISTEFVEHTRLLHDEMKKWEKEEVASNFKIKGELLDAVYDNIQNQEELGCQAVEVYTGLVFKQLEISEYNSEDWAFMDQHLRILSAFYGVLKPTDVISAYRLDMKIKSLKLYDFWSEKINDYFVGKEVVSLASDEFSKMLKVPYITITFKESIEGKLITKGTYAKMARGKMLDYIIKNKVNEIEALKAYNVDGYAFSEMYSSENEFVFVR